MALALSSNDIEVIQRVDEINLDYNRPEAVTSKQELEDLYEIQRTIDYIKKKQCRTVALQFPDYLLQDSCQVVNEIKSQIDAKVCILGDTTHGSFDVDEVAAAHISSDLIVHYGKSSFKSTPKTDVLFVFGKLQLNVDNIILEFFNNLTKVSIEKPVIVLLDLNCQHIADELREKIHRKLEELGTTMQVIIADIGKVDPRKTATDDDACLRNCPDCDCREEDSVAVSNNSSVVPKKEEKKSDLEDLIPGDDPYQLPPFKDDSALNFKGERIGFYRIPTEKPLGEELSIFFVGEKSGRNLHNFVMQRPQASGFVYDVTTNQCSQLTNFVRRELNQRYFIVEKVRDAKRIGIIVGTMGITGYRQIIQHLKSIIKQTGKQCYTISVGKPNIAKLANYPEMDVYVLFACAEQSFVDNPRDYYQPIATPYEVEVALNKNRQWGGKYITDFCELLPGGSNYIKFEPDTFENDFSLIDGSVRCFDAAEDESKCESNKQVALTNEEKALQMFHPFSSASYSYENRSWNGLVVDLGQTPVCKAQPGRDGVPTSYKQIEN